MGSELRDALLRRLDEEAMPSFMAESSMFLVGARIALMLLLEEAEKRSWKEYMTEVIDLDELRAIVKEILGS